MNDRSLDPLLRKIIAFHILDTKDSGKIEKQKILPLFRELNPDPAMPEEDEIVEDAGLFDHDDMREPHAQQRSNATGQIASETRHV